MQNVDIVPQAHREIVQFPHRHGFRSIFGITLQDRDARIVDSTSNAHWVISPMDWSRNPQGASSLSYTLSVRWVGLRQKASTPSKENDAITQAEGTREMYCQPMPVVWHCSPKHWKNPTSANYSNRSVLPCVLALAITADLSCPYCFRYRNLGPSMNCKTKSSSDLKDKPWFHISFPVFFIIWVNMIFMRIYNKS